jgi:hypothetical protein
MRAMVRHGRRSRFDCLGHLAPDEPYFVLRAQDCLAAEHVETWAIEAQLNGCAPQKVAEARRVAVAMRRWPKRKMPD